MMVGVRVMVRVRVRVRVRDVPVNAFHFEGFACPVLEPSDPGEPPMGEG